MADLLTNLLAVVVAVGLPAGVLWLLFQMMNDRLRVDTDLCEACGYDLRASMGPCPECGAIAGKTLFHCRRRLREAWPANPICVRPPAEDETTVTVHESSDGMLADLLRQHLEVRGIAASILEPTEQVSGITGRSHVIGMYAVCVWSGDADRVRELIDWLFEEEANATAAFAGAARGELMAEPTDQLPSDDAPPEELAVEEALVGEPPAPMTAPEGKDPFVEPSRVDPQTERVAPDAGTKMFVTFFFLIVPPLGVILLGLICWSLFKKFMATTE